MNGGFYLSGTPEPIRTADLFLRRELLYPSELRGQHTVSVTQPAKNTLLSCQAERSICKRLVIVLTIVEDNYCEEKGQEL